MKDNILLWRIRLIMLQFIRIFQTENLKLKAAQLTKFSVGSINWIKKSSSFVQDSLKTAFSNAIKNINIKNKNPRKKKYNSIKKIKIIFGIMAFLFFITIVAGQYYRVIDVKILEKYPFYESLTSLINIDQIVSDKISYESLNPNQYENCTFVQPGDKTIILRLDDLGAWRYNDAVEKITDEVLSRDLSISEAVIPFEIEKDRRFIRWTKSFKSDPKVEFALHGYYHSVEEFGQMDYTESKYYLEKGKKQMMDYIHIVPVTFIPPYNVYSEDTTKALVDTGFKIISAGEEDINYDGSLAHLGYGARTFDYGQKSDNPGYIQSSMTIEKCRESLDKNNICVVMIHPQDYLEPAVPGQTRNINETRYADFTNLLDRLQEFDASFKTYKDLLECPSL